MYQFSRAIYCELAPRIARQDIAAGYEADIAPCIKRKVPVIWVNRHGEKLEGRKAPDATVKNFGDAAAKPGAK